PNSGLQFDRFSDQFGAPVSNAGLMTLAGDEKDGIIVLHTKQAVTADEIQNGMLAGLKKLGLPGAKFDKADQGRYALYESKALGMAFFLVDDHRAVYGKPERLRVVLARDGLPDFSAPLQEAIKLTDFNAVVAYAGGNVKRLVANAAGGQQPIPAL